MPSPPQSKPAAPEPAGFGSCKRCAYRDVGTSEICFGCAAQTIQFPSETACRVCDQHVDGGGRLCSNYLCQSTDRAFEASYAIAMKTGELEAAIWRYKFDRRWGYGLIFGRVLNGFLYEADLVADDDLIIPSPTHLPPGSVVRDDHTGFIIKSASEQDERGLPYVIDPAVIIKTAETPKLKQLNLHDRRANATAIYDSLLVTDPDNVDGRRIWVFDDVFTTGTTLNVVAMRLREAGATEVFGLALARQPWGS